MEFSFSKIIGALISSAALVPMFWWNVVPQADTTICKGDSYSVTRDGATLDMNRVARFQLCSHVAENPRPVK